MYAVDETVHLVQFAAKCRHGAVVPCLAVHRGLRVASLEEFELVADGVDLLVEGLQEDARLEHAGVIGHVGMVSPKLNDRYPPCRFDDRGLFSRLPFQRFKRKLILMADLSEQTALAQVEERLSSTYDQLPRSTVADAVRDAQAAFEGRPIRDFVPLLVERRARALLSAPPL